MQSGLCLTVTDINIPEPGSQSVGLAWMCFVGICCHCRGFPVHWLWNQLYPNWICQSQSKVEGNTIQHCQFHKPGLLEGKMLLKVKYVIPVLFQLVFHWPVKELVLPLTHAIGWVNVAVLQCSCKHSDNSVEKVFTNQPKGEKQDQNFIGKRLQSSDKLHKLLKS